MKSSKSPEMAILCLRGSIRQLKKINKNLIKTIFLVLVALCLVGTGFGQKEKEIKPLFIDSQMPDILISKIINYKDSAAKFSSFKKKLTIVDFWNTHCTVCIAQFPKEIALQKQFGKDIQLIMVTAEPKQLVEDFIARWETMQHTKFTLPIIVSDTILHQYLHQFYQPNYAWFDYEPHLIAQTNEYFLNPANILYVLKEIDALRRLLGDDKKQSQLIAHPLKKVE